MAEKITECRYTDAGKTVVKAQIDGRPASIPVAPGNRHWDQIVSEGIPIADPK